MRTSGIKEKKKEQTRSFTHFKVSKEKKINNPSDSTCYSIVKTKKERDNCLVLIIVKVVCYYDRCIALPNFKTFLSKLQVFYTTTQYTPNRNSNLLLFYKCGDYL